MKKAELIEKIAAETGMTKKDVTAVCDALVASIADVMAAGDSIQLSGFGTFSSKVRAARTGRNPQTGAAIEIPESRLAAFSASKALKDKLNG
jgi:DNA-binding protein HU-beta